MSSGAALERDNDRSRIIEPAPDTARNAEFGLVQKRAQEEERRRGRELLLDLEDRYAAAQAGGGNSVLPVLTKIHDNLLSEQTEKKDLTPQAAAESLIAARTRRAIWLALAEDPQFGETALQILTNELQAGREVSSPGEIFSRYQHHFRESEDGRAMLQQLLQIEMRLGENRQTVDSHAQSEVKKTAAMRLHSQFARKLAKQEQELKEFKFTGRHGELADFFKKYCDLKAFQSQAFGNLISAMELEQAKGEHPNADVKQAVAMAGRDFAEKLDRAANTALLRRIGELAQSDTILDPVERYGEFAPYFEGNVESPHPNPIYNRQLSANLETAHPKLVPGLSEERGLNSPAYEFLTEIKYFQHTDHSLQRIRGRQLGALELAQKEHAAAAARLNDPAAGIKLFNAAGSGRIKLEITKPISAENLIKHIFALSSSKQISAEHYRMLGEVNPQLAQELERAAESGGGGLIRPGVISIAGTQAAAELSQTKSRIDLLAAQLATPVSTTELQSELNSDSYHRRMREKQFELNAALAQDGFFRNRESSNLLPELITTIEMTLQEAGEKIFGRNPQKSELTELLDLNPQLRKPIELHSVGQNAELIGIARGSKLTIPPNSAIAAKLQRTFPGSVGEEPLKAIESRLAGLGIRLTVSDGEVRVQLIKRHSTADVLREIEPSKGLFGFVDQETENWLKARNLPVDLKVALTPGIEFSINDTALGRAVRQVEHLQMERAGSRARLDSVARSFLARGLEVLESTNLQDPTVRTLRPMTVREVLQLPPGTSAEFADLRIAGLLKENPQLRPQDPHENQAVLNLEIPAGTELRGISSSLQPLAAAYAGYLALPLGSNFAETARPLPKVLSEAEQAALLNTRAGLAAQVVRSSQALEISKFSEQLAKLRAEGQLAAGNAEKFSEFEDRLRFYEEQFDNFFHSQEQSPQLVSVRERLTVIAREMKVQTYGNHGQAMLDAGEYYRAREAFGVSAAIVKCSLGPEGKLDSEQRSRAADSLLRLETAIARAQALGDHRPQNTFERMKKESLPLAEGRKLVEPVIGEIDRQFAKIRETLKDFPDPDSRAHALALAQEQLKSEVYGTAGDIESRHQSQQRAAGLILAGGEPDMTKILAESGASALYSERSGQRDASYLGLVWGTDRISTYSDEQLSKLSAAYGKLPEADQAAFLGSLEQMSATAGQMQDADKSNMHAELFRHLIYDHHNHGDVESALLELRGEVFEANRMIAQGQGTLEPARMILRGAAQSAERLIDRESANVKLAELARLHGRTQLPEERVKILGQMQELRRNLQTQESLIQGFYATELSVVTQQNALSGSTESAAQVTKTVDAIIARERVQIERLRSDNAAIDREREAMLQERLKKIPKSEHAQARAAELGKLDATVDGEVWKFRKQANSAEIARRERAQLHVRVQEVSAYVEAAAAKDTAEGKLNAQQMLDKVAAEFKSTAVGTEAEKLVADFRNEHGQGQLATLKQFLRESQNSGLVESLAWTQGAGLAGAGIAIVVATPASAPVGYGIGVFAGWAAMTTKNLIVGRERIEQANATGLSKISHSEAMFNGGALLLDLVPFTTGGVSGLKKIGVEGLQELLKPSVLAREIRKAAVDAGLELTEEQAVRIARAELINTFGREALDYGGTSLTLGGLGFALGPMAYHAIETELNPNVKPHERAKAREQYFKEAVTFAANTLATNAVSRHIDGLGANGTVDIGKLRRSYLDPAIQRVAEADARSRIAERIAELPSPFSVDELAPERGTSTLATKLTVEENGPSAARIKITDEHLALAQGLVRRTLGTDGLRVEPTVVFAGGDNPLFDAAYNWSTNRIIVSRNVDAAKLPGLIAHELEHVRQTQFIATAGLAGLELPDNFYLRGPQGEVTGALNIHPDVLKAVSDAPLDPANPSGPRFKDSEMIQYWGQRIGRSLANSADANAVGNTADYRGALAELTAEFRALELERDQKLQEANHTAEEAFRTNDEAGKQRALKLLEESDAAQSKLDYFLARIADHFKQGLEQAGRNTRQSESSGSGTAAASNFSGDDAIDYAIEYNKDIGFAPTVNDKADLYWGLQRNNALGLVDEPGAREALKKSAQERLLTELTEFSQAPQNFNLAYGMQLEDRARALGMLDSLPPGLTTELARRNALIDELSAFDNYPESFPPSRAAALYWDARQLEGLELSGSAKRLEAAAHTHAVNRAEKLASDPRLICHDERVRLAQEVHALGMTETVSGAVSSRLSEACEAEFYLEMLEMGDEIGADGVKALTDYACSLPDPSVLARYLDEEHPQAPDLSALFQPETPALHQVAAAAAVPELRLPVQTPTITAAKAKHLLMQKFSEFSRTNERNAAGGTFSELDPQREVLLFGRDGNGGLVAAAQERVALGQAPDLLTAFDLELAEARSALVKLAREQPGDPSILPQVLDVRESQQAVAALRSDLEAHAIRVRDEAAARLREAERDAAAPHPVSSDTAGDPELTQSPEQPARERAKLAWVGIDDLERGRKYYQEGESCFTYEGKGPNGSIRVRFHDGNPQDVRFSPSRENFIYPKGDARFAPQRFAPQLIREHAAAQGLTHQRAALWFGMGEIYNQMKGNSGVKTQTGAIARYDKILQSIAPGESLSPFMERLQRQMVHGPLNQADLELAGNFMRAVYTQTGVDLVRIGTSRQASTNTRGSFYTFDTTEDFAALFAAPDGKPGINVASVKSSIDDVFRRDLWNMGVTALDGASADGPGLPQHDRTIVLGSYIPKDRRGHDTDPNTVMLTEVKDHPSKENARAMVRARLPEIKEFLTKHADVLEGKEVIIVAAPGSEEMFSASDALAGAMKSELGYRVEHPFVRFAEHPVRRANGDTTRLHPGSQKSQYSLVLRVRNVGAVFDVATNRETTKPNQVYILVDDIHTTGATTAILRERLQPADVLTITFGGTCNATP